jgi:hypothetical protein
VVEETLGLLIFQIDGARKKKRRRQHEEKRKSEVAGEVGDETSPSRFSFSFVAFVVVVYF